MDNVLGTRPPLHTEMDTNPEKERHIQLLYEQVLKHYNLIGTPEGLDELKKELKTTSITGPVYIGVGDSLEDIIVDGNVQTGVFPKNLQVACSNDYVYVVYPASNNVDVVMLMGCFEVPLEARQTETIDGTDYYVFRSSNAYTYAGKLAFIV